jgi:acyl dehydratase
VNSALTIAITLGQSVIDTSYNAFANLGMDELRLTTPVFAGDTLYAESLVLGKRESKSRPYAGIVHIKTRSINQDGAVVLSYKRKFYVYKTAADLQRDTFPEAHLPFDPGD